VKTAKLFLLGLILQLFCIITVSLAQKNTPDTVKTGIYVTSIHDIEFKDKEYTVNFWL
jgi:hypothetical protein